jgi:anti-sigma B factor antagonist
LVKEDRMAFDVRLEMAGDVARLTLTGSLDAATAPRLKQVVEEAAGHHPSRLVLFASALEFMASAGLRVLIFAKQKMGAAVDIYVVGCQGPVRNTLEMSGFHHSVFLQDTYDE